MYVTVANWVHTAHTLNSLMLSAYVKSLGRNTLFLRLVTHKHGQTVRMNQGLRT